VARCGKKSCALQKPARVHVGTALPRACAKIESARWRSAIWTGEQLFWSAAEKHISSRMAHCDVGSKTRQGKEGVGVLTHCQSDTV